MSHTELVEIARCLFINQILDVCALGSVDHAQTTVNLFNNVLGMVIGTDPRKVSLQLRSVKQRIVTID